MIGRFSLGLVLILLLGADATAIPAFARKYRVSCQLCHNPVPTLNEFGETFAGNGFRFTADEAPRDTIDTGDPMLELLRDIPLAVRFDAYLQGFTDDGFSRDFKTPYNVKVLSGGSLFSGVSYYFYFFLFERGEVGGIEDAFIYFNDIGGAPIDVAVGQFQVSDPMFKRELRLEFDDYAIYRARVGDQPQDLTYDRGITAAWEIPNIVLTGTVVNGNGKGPDVDRNLDNDSPLDVFGHLNWSALPELRLGVMGYYGQSDSELAGRVRNELWMAGGDATLTFGNLEVSAQYIHRDDSNPLFLSTDPDVQTDGGFAEAIYRFRNSRFHALALWNYIWCSEPLLDARLGGPGGIQRYHTFSAGFSWMWRTNVRTLVEGGWDIEQETTRWTVGISAAY
ncbi:MAG: hypothetical protein GTO46_03865 [Gemmatimonadetes bacterium]|nr:hypothetical protein [Gemmatimonadota bacterium]NIO32937.1 hypothetical protein [Gemmatimonadota bacterium]